VRGVTFCSGGRTGADRAALDFAIEFGLPHGGWCPRGRKAEDGPIEERYQLTETPSLRYSQRTEWNVRDSDATIVFSIAPQVSGGSALTIAIAQRLGKPWLHLSAVVVSAEGADPAEVLLDFLATHRVSRLNVAGPRASQEPEVAAFVRQVFVAALDASESHE
jgi:hypothetical protein